jgi:DNA polymerase-4
MEREIIYVDVASFAVAVERVVHPELRGRPVIVAAVGTARSVVTALSSEAWHAGIRKGMAAARAKRRCRNVVVLPPNEPLYARASNAIFRILQNFSPALEPSGPGHTYVDITGTGRLFGPARDAAWRAQKEIRRQLRLDTSLGVASNKLVSRIASEVSKPMGLQDVPHGNEFSFLSPLPVRLLPGVGPGTQEELKELNIRIIHDIAVMKLDSLTLAFGNFGLVLYQRARGIDNTPVYPMRAAPAVSHEEVLPEDTNDCDLLKGVLWKLCAHAAEQLRRQQQRAGRMDLHIRYSDYREDGGKVKLSHSLQPTPVLYDCALPLLERILVRRTRVRSMQLQLTELMRGSLQLELFADPKPERRLKLDLALDELHKRYGASAIMRGVPTVPFPVSGFPF